MRTLGSAYRHGLSHADIQHAIAHVVVIVPERDHLMMWLGPDRDGRYLEVGVVERDDEQVVIHAMPMRMRKFGQYLPKEQSR